MSESKNLTAQVSIQFFAPRNLEIFNIKTQELSDATEVICSDGQTFYFHDHVGSKDLSRCYIMGSVRTKRQVIYDKRFITQKNPRGRNTSNVITHRYKNFDAMAHNLERILPVTGAELKALLQPYFAQRFNRIFISTVANGIWGTSNEGFEEKFGVPNHYILRGIPFRPDFKKANLWLESHGSDFRVKILGIEKIEHQKLMNRVAELERLLKRKV